MFISAPGVPDRLPSVRASLPRYVLHFKVWKVNHTQQGTKQFFNGQEGEISNSDVWLK